MVYTCALNNAGGVEADVTISRLTSGTGEPHNPQFEGQGYYIVAGGASAYYTYRILSEEIRQQGVQARVRDVTADIGIISLQGPTSREILQNIVTCDLTDEQLPPNCTLLTKCKCFDSQYSKIEYNVRLLRVSFVGELGYELHVPREYCAQVYKTLMKVGGKYNLRNAGYRALYALSSEKGYHLWSFDLRPDDTPVEAGLEFTCRKTSKTTYKGQQSIQQQQANGIRKRLVYLTLDDQVPIWGLEGVYRNGEAVGFLRRAEYAYYLRKPFAQAYIQRLDGQMVDVDYIQSGNYEIDILGERYKAECHLRSPFDPEGKRIKGIYN